MDDIDHTHPHTGEAFGANEVWERGRGEADSADDTDTTDEVKSVEAVTEESTDE